MAKDQPSPGSERRSHPRTAVRRNAFAVHGEVAWKCKILDVSASGARVQMRSPIPWPDSFVLVDPKASAIHFAQIAWRSETEAGLRFIESEIYEGPLGGVAGAAKRALQFL